MKKTTAVVCVALSMIQASLAFAGDGAVAEASRQPESASQGLSVDLEIDPIAYALGGYSLHAGLRFGERFRLDLGAFAADVPEAMHHNPGFDVAMRGVGTKLDVYLFDDGTGPFAGAELGIITSTIVDAETGISNAATRVSPSLRVGWLIPIAGGFYATPWVGVGYTPGVEDRVVGGKTFEENGLVIFPTVHLGYRF